MHPSEAFFVFDELEYLGACVPYKPACVWDVYTYLQSDDVRGRWRPVYSLRAMLIHLMAVPSLPLFPSSIPLFFPM